MLAELLVWMSVQKVDEFNLKYSEGAGTYDLTLKRGILEEHLYVRDTILANNPEQVEAAFKTMPRLLRFLKIKEGHDSIN